MNATDFKELQNKVNQLQQQHDKAVMRKETLMERLKKEFGLDSIEEAQKKLEEMREDIEAQEVAINKREKQIQDKITEYEDSLNA